MHSSSLWHFLFIIVFIIITINTVNAKVNILSSSSSLSQKWIIDTDVDVEDTIAIMYMLSLHSNSNTYNNNNNFEISAITNMGNAFTRLPQGTEILKRILYYSTSNDTTTAKKVTEEKKKIILSQGASQALSQIGIFNYQQIPTPFIEGSEKLYGLLNELLYPVPEHIYSSLPFEISSLNAIQVMYNTLVMNFNEKQQKTNILAIGSLTNIALLLNLYSDRTIQSMINHVYIMGGAVNIPGNLMKYNSQNHTFYRSENLVSEYNIFADPESAYQVFKSGIPITLIPLDLTNQVPITKQFMNTFQSYCKVINDEENSSNGLFSQKRIINYVYQVLKKLDLNFQFEDWSFWDTVTAMIGVQLSQQSIKNGGNDVGGGSVECQVMNLTIVNTDSIYNSGQTLKRSKSGVLSLGSLQYRQKEDGQYFPVRVCSTISPQEFEKNFIQTICPN